MHVKGAVGGYAGEEEVTMRMQAILMLPVKHLPRAIEFYEKTGFDVDWEYAYPKYEELSRTRTDLSRTELAGTPALNERSMGNEWQSRSITCSRKVERMRRRRVGAAAAGN